MGTATDAGPPPGFRIAAVRLRRRRRLGGEPFARPTRPLPDRSGRSSGVAQRYGRAVGLLPGPLPDGSQQPFFFLLRPAPTFLRDRAQSTDPVVESDEVLTELLEAVKLGDLLLRLAERGRIGKGLGHRLAGHAAREAKLWIVSGVVVFSAVAGRLATASGHGSDGAGSQITQAEELFQEFGSLGFQSGEVIRHKGFLSIAQPVCTYRDAQNHAIKKGNPLVDSSMSPTLTSCRACHSR